MCVIEVVFIAVAAIALLVVVGLLVRRFRVRKHELTRPELRNRATTMSGRLVDLVEEQQEGRPLDDPIIKDHELSHRRVTFYDEEMQRIYHRDYLPEIVELKEHFAERGIRNNMLEDLHESAENEADLRTISTALGEMATRLKT